MRAIPQRRLVRSSGGLGLRRALAFGSLAFVTLAFGAFGCGGSTPMDQWITKNPEAGADFDAPVRETIPRSDGGVDSGGGTGSDAGAVTDDAAASDVVTGSDDAGDSDAAAGAD
jgi:hypothetical protein